MRLFSFARYDGLDGMPFPAPPYSFPSKDGMADYLESYAGRFDLPVQTGTRVTRLSHDGERYVVATNRGEIEAAQVIVAMANYQEPRVPAFAAALDEGIVQFHSREYRNPSQLQDGAVLLVGGGNSGAEIAKELSGRHQTWLASAGNGELPFRVDSLPRRRLLAPLLFRGIFHRVLTVDTPIGRKAQPASDVAGALTGAISFVNPDFPPLWLLTCLVVLTSSAAAQLPGSRVPGGCDVPAAARTSESSCYLTAIENLSDLPAEDLFWHLYQYPTRAAAESAKPRLMGTIAESFGKIRLYIIAPETWAPPSGQRIA